MDQSLRAVHGGFHWQLSVAAEAGEAASRTGLFNLLPWDGAEVESLRVQGPRFMSQHCQTRTK